MSDRKVGDGGEVLRHKASFFFHHSPAIPVFAPPPRGRSPALTLVITGVSGLRHCRGDARPAPGRVGGIHGPEAPPTQMQSPGSADACLQPGRTCQWGGHRPPTKLSALRAQG